MLEMTHQTLLAALLKVQQKVQHADAQGGVYPSTGICSAVSEALGLFTPGKAEERHKLYEHWLGPLFRTWPEFSGERPYPVWANREKYPNGEAEYDSTTEHWGPGIPHGDARRRLLQHMIDSTAAALE